MDIDTMRRIDFWAGIPICFLLAIFHNIGKLFRGKQELKNPKKFLFIEISEMGSTIIAYSAMSYIKKKYQNAQLYFLIFKRNRESIDILKIIPPENVITIRDSSFLGLTKDTIIAIWRLRKEKIDVSFDLELFSRFSAIINYLLGAKARVGFHNFTAEGLYRGNLQTHNVMYNHYYHMSQNFMALVKSLENTETPMLKQAIDKKEIKTPKLVTERKYKETIIKKLQSLNPSINEKKKIILFNPGASKLLPLREWPLQYYKELAIKILEDKNSFIVITGLVGDKEYAQEICKFTRNDRCLDLTGMTKSLKELVDLYNTAHILITNDSGPAHFSALSDIRTIVFYGPETPVLYGPLGENYTALYSNFACSPCVSAYNHRKSLCTNNRCLQAIKPETVFNLIISHFARGK